MIKFLIDRADGKKVIGLALSEQNVIRLKNDEPIVTDLDQLNMLNVDVIIFYGETEEKIVNKLIEHGLITSETQIKDPHMKEKVH